MCGIVGYIGGREASPLLMEGLRRLEYRGYDSAGIAVLDNGTVEIRRAEGKLRNLEELLNERPVHGTRGVGHTRWATHGRPSEINAHPHTAGSIVVVHNGIIENYLELKEALRARGRVFTSETDTEIIAHLIDEKRSDADSLFEAVRTALGEVRGSYAVAVISKNAPDTLVAAKLGSPLVVGQGDGEYHVASDIPAMLPHTREMIFLDDGEMVLITPGGMTFSDMEGRALEKETTHITWDPVMAEKGGYRHFMLKEIFEQPRAVADTIAGRLTDDEGDVFFEHLRFADEDLREIEKIFIIACGTSWHAALLGKFLFEKHCRIPTEVDIASEFRYRDPLITSKTLTILISQSGETADTLAALREARAKGGRVVAVCNVVGSSIARKSDGVIYTHAGPEIGVASTKAFTTQIVALYLFSLKLARARGRMDADDCRRRLKGLLELPRHLEEVLKTDDRIQPIAQEFMDATDFLYLGRGNQYPIALEGALKLKEISYIHAEGYPAGEMKHGPIALIDEHLPVVVVAPGNAICEKVVSNTEEVRARGGRVIAVTTAGALDRIGPVDGVIVVPEIDDDLMPVLTTVPLQLLAYHVAVLRGTDVDQPRNLAKSVTVE